MRRYFPALVGLAVLVAAGPVSAQVGGIVKKAAPKVPGAPTAQPAAPAPAKPKCDNSQLVIDNDVVSRYQKSLAARDGYTQQLSKQGGSVGAYYSAVFKKQAIQKRKAAFDNQEGPDWDKQQAITKRLQNGDTTAMKDYMALEQSLNPNSVQVPDLTWEDQQKVQAGMDSTMMAAGKFDPCDWQNLGERFPRMVYTLVQDENAKDFQGFGTAKEAAAIKPHLAELAPAMGIAYESAADKARKKKRADSLATAATAAPTPPSSGDPQMDCVAQAQRDWAAAHKAELDALQKSQDTNAMMKFSMQMQQEAMAKCMPQ